MDKILEYIEKAWGIAPQASLAILFALGFAFMFGLASCLLARRKFKISKGMLKGNEMAGKTKYNMWLLAVQSYIAFGLAALLSIIALIQGKKTEPWYFACLIAALIGLGAYAAISALAKRVSALEKQLRQSNIEDTTSAEEEV